MLGPMVWSWAGSGLRSCAAISVVLALGGASGCVLDNPKYDEGGLLTESDSDSVSASASSDSASTTGTETATGSDASGSESATGTTTGEPTTTEPTTDATVTTTTGPTTDSSSDSDSGTTTSGGELCAVEEKVDVYADGDMDGYGAGDSLGQVCPNDVGPGVSVNHGDCDDGNDQVYPGADELCDGKDNNCNGLLDEASPMNVSCSLLGTTCFLMEFGGHYYYACDKDHNPNDANNECKKLALGGGAVVYHVKLDGEEEHLALTPLVALLSDGPSIGLMDEGILDLAEQYKWIGDGSKLEGYGATIGVPPWSPGQPDNGFSERYVMMEKISLLWVDIEGYEKHPFICEGIPGG